MNELKCAAIKYCELSGLDPYEMLEHGHPIKNGVQKAGILQSPRWVLTVPAVKQWRDMREAFLGMK